jgi:hypothetical protein
LQEKLDDSNEINQQSQLELDKLYNKMNSMNLDSPTRLPHDSNKMLTLNIPKDQKRGLRSESRGGIGSSEARNRGDETPGYSPRGPKKSRADLNRIEEKVD